MLFPGSVFGSEFSVTAVESNTVVTIVRLLPRADMLPGSLIL